VKNNDLLRDSLGRLRAALKTDGEVVDCDMAMPFCLFRTPGGRCTTRGEEIPERCQQADHEALRHPERRFRPLEEGLSAERLKASGGAVHRDAFDFDAMSRLLTESSPKVALPESRGRRIRGLLSVLKSQRFFAPARMVTIDGVASPGFVFENCAEHRGLSRRLQSERTGQAIAAANSKSENAAKRAMMCSSPGSATGSIRRPLVPDI
jgi:hypothetical protein